MIFWFFGLISVLLLYWVVFKPLIQDSFQTYWADDAVSKAVSKELLESSSLDAQLSELAADYAAGKLHQADYEALVKATKLEYGASS